MDYSYKLTQEQRLALTQEMQLSIKVLQMSANDLREYINNEYEENPVLEIKDEFISNTNEKSTDLDKHDYKEMIKYLEFDNYGAQSYGSYDDEEVSPFNFISQKKSLKEYLHEQVMEIEEEDLKKEVADYIIENLDSRGYLEISISEIAKELNLSEKLIEEGLEIVQSLEPYGIGARNIKECLKNQLKYLGYNDEKLKIIVENYLEDLADNKYKNIASQLNISPREAQRYGDIIRKLEPKPSRGFYTGEEVKYILPDAEIRKVQNEFLVIMNDKLVPNLSISGVYKEVINKNQGDDVNSYVKEKLDKALFLIKSIEQRRSTLYKVLEKIVEKQREYFEYGINYLKPMTLKDISKEIEMHESTVSRAIKEKYILTSYGTVKIKELFTTGVSSSKSEDEIAVSNIKNRIKKLVDGEDKTKPFSDQYICDYLNRENINISRRTVAKYREELGIRSSSKRKRI
ncbi:RNA polymerase factor sigma-54 [Clostridium sp. SHJSY1]|uniref:RNA polymerase factor sigma-54 n=1 Tax=Clostridium sp. SHJSY1 TaxID=2942483 RepID=UPI002876352C|nr:RNA polymerase factor sigma-54 [Clostridium sp. SHJSY1]MDS0526858.1 RNA polymerase factor sigma-54 [Clostridium sp. SHJSY1]